MMTAAFPRFSLLTSHFSLLTFVLSLLAARVHVGRADVVEVEGRPMAVGVEVVELKDGQLFYRLPAGRLVARALQEIKSLQVAGWSAFNAAEDQRRNGQIRQSAASYEQALAEAAGAGSPAAGKLDRDLLVRCRLLSLFESQGQFDRAVVLYLDIAERMPVALETLRPARLPTAGSTFLPAAITAIDAAIERHRDTAFGESLARWRAQWPIPDGQGSQPGQEVQAASRSPKPAERPRDELDIQLAEMETLVTAGRFDEALAKTQSWQNEKAGLRRAELFYWQGRAWLGKSLTDQGDEARRDGRRAGLAFMRVVIHFPGHRLVPECLHWASEICQRTGLAAPAAQLRAELLRAQPATRPASEGTESKVRSEK